ncbi:GNAT family N-acetyltransferase [Nocardioides sp. Soil796]|uniref:GNAT family N-acetyltransferase n=1 Tax=Nocardioides sp. Soil796 TaxID=1736412 RepID=UPI000709AA18|nr:GNAT family N-acetyltransferase [Nocardioides sp. Soil796]KRF11790.1 hypothetical protein ASH02_17600 [Nocardioides sp. Soil796]
MPLLRPISPGDHAFVLDLNHRNVEVLSPMDQTRLDTLLGWADRADIIEHDGEPAGFVMTFAPRSSYDSENYLWFTGHYDTFYYLDRIVLDQRFRRLGLGRRVYEELERVAAAYDRMVLEVNIDPPNRPSLDFHRRRGYDEVHRLGRAHVVALMALELAARPQPRSGK